MLLFKDRLLLYYGFLSVNRWLDRVLKLKIGVLPAYIFKLLVKQLV